MPGPNARHWRQSEDKATHECGRLEGPYRLDPRDVNCSDCVRIIDLMRKHRQIDSKMAR